MAADYTATALLAEIRRRGRIPTDDPSYTNANLLLEADTQIREVFVPLIMKSRVDYYLRYEDQTLVTNQQAYPIPSRAVASTLRQVLWIDSTGRELELMPDVATAVPSHATTSGPPYGYVIRDDEVVLLPKPNAALGTLRIWYEYRPASLVTSGFFTVASVAGGNVTLTTSVTWTADSRYDFVKAKQPFALLAVDADPTGTGTNTVVPFGTSPSSRIAAGDYMCLPGESPVPQLPGELFSPLALAVAAEVLAQYSPEESLIKRNQLGQVLGDWQASLSPRQRGRQIKQINQNSAIRRGSTSRRSSNWEP